MNKDIAINDLGCLDTCVSNLSKVNNLLLGLDRNYEEAGGGGGHCASTSCAGASTAALSRVGVQAQDTYKLPSFSLLT